MDNILNEGVISEQMPVLKCIRIDEISHWSMNINFSDKTYVHFYLVLLLAI